MYILAKAQYPVRKLISRTKRYYYRVPRVPHIPTINDIVEEARRVARAIEHAERREIKVASEEPGSTDEVEEPSHRVVYSILPVSSVDRVDELINYVPVGPSFSTYVGIDGSSRRLEAYTLLLGVYATAVSVVDGAYAVGTYPDTGAYPAIRAGDAAVASIAPDPGIGLRYVATSPLIDPRAVVEASNCTSYFGSSCELVKKLSYGNGYNVPTMLDENRSYLENAALEYVATSRNICDKDTRVLVDGPLYMTPGLLVQFYSAASSLSYTSIRPLVQLIYVLSYVYNSLYRARLIELLGKRGALVAGVVKRINRSRVLVNALRASISQALDIPDTDPQLVEQLLRSKGIRARLPPYAHGVAVAIRPVISVIDLSTIADLVQKVLGVTDLYTIYAYNRAVTRTRMTLKQLIDWMRDKHYLAKRSYYLVVKGPLMSQRILRVEFPQAVPAPPVELGPDNRAIPQRNPAGLKAIIRHDSVVLGEVAWLSLQPRQLEAPLPIVLADRVSRIVSRDAAHVWFRELQDKVTFTYETLLEMTS